MAVTQVSISASGTTLYTCPASTRSKVIVTKFTGNGATTTFTAASASFPVTSSGTYPSGTGTATSEAALGNGSTDVIPRIIFLTAGETITCNGSGTFDGVAFEEPA